MNAENGASIRKQGGLDQQITSTESAEFLDKSNIVLVGYRGSGKTTLGRPLASHLGMGFIDLDNLIEHRTGMTIPQLWKFGEGYFREKEADAIRSVSGLRNMVIATGGGVFDREENIEALKENGMIAYLKVDPETLEERVRDDNSRPRFDESVPLIEEIKNKLAIRGPKWEENADVTIDNGGNDINFALEKMVLAVNEFRMRQRKLHELSEQR